MILGSNQMAGYSVSMTYLSKGASIDLILFLTSIAKLNFVELELTLVVASARTALISHVSADLSVFTDGASV